MPRRLLLIGEPPSSALRGWFDDLREKAPDLLCERVGWNARLREHISDSGCKLVVIAALPPTDDPAGFIRSLKADTLAPPTLAILPEDASEELLLASQLLDDFIVAPVRSGELRHRIRRILGDNHETVDAAHSPLLRELRLAGMVGRSPAFLDTIGKIPRAARSRGPVLIDGETGTGKELCARAVHNLGPRRDFPFIPVDCATLPDHLFESELFGHMRGAFTDAHDDHKGLVALADGGTLFLDEVDSLSLSAQAKLLRFLEERSYRPLGAERFLSLDVNIVAATNTDLSELIRKKQFRADLFFRLNLFRLHLAPLRERREDIALLARHFVERVCAENGIATKTLTPAGLRKLCRYDWPGNARELCNVIERAVVFSEGGQILPSHIEDPGVPSDRVTEPGFDSFRQARSRAIESFERRYVEELMRECGGNISRAARLARTDRRAFGRLAKRYNIRRGDS
jgi:two-component system, NtrC family, response regulator GlrR